LFVLIVNFDFLDNKMARKTECVQFTGWVLYVFAGENMGGMLPIQI